MPRQYPHRQNKAAGGRRPPELPIDKEFPVAFANNLARLESYNKHLYRPNTYLHKWWARRCGTTFRLILKHLIQDPEARSYYRPGGLAGQTILDPMLGGGTTLHEAIRLGANVIGADVDPIPILQARATLSHVPLVELEESFDDLIRSLRRDLAHLFQTICPHCAAGSELSFVLYGRRQACECGPVLVVDSTILRYESDGAVVALCPACGDVYRAAEDSLARAHVCSSPAQSFPILEKGERLCTGCGKPPAELTNTPYYAR
jgi:putative DNA methylase